MDIHDITSISVDEGWWMFPIIYQKLTSIMRYIYRHLIDESADPAAYYDRTVYQYHFGGTRSGVWRVGHGLQEPPIVDSFAMVHSDLWLICGYKVVFTVPIEEYFEFGRVSRRIR